MGRLYFGFFLAHIFCAHSGAGLLLLLLVAQIPISGLEGIWKEFG